MAKRRISAEDRKIEQLYGKHCSGMQISVMKIPDLFRMARAKLQAGESDDSIAAAMVEFVKASALAAVAVLAIGSVAHADSFQTRACKALRHGVQQSEPIRKAAPIRVTEESRNGHAIRVFVCAPLPGGEHMAPVLAEATR